jgi:anti-sigma B factor antagonist
MQIEVERSGSEIAVTIDGNIDTEGGQRLTAERAAITKLDDIERVVFDLTTVRSTTSSGIGKLMNFYKHLDSIGAAMEIRGISDVLHEQFTDIHLDRIIPISAE